MSDIDQIDIDPNDDGEIEDEKPAAAVSTESLSATARRLMREQLQRDMEEFMKRGGEIKQIEDNVRADPPRKPSSDYGSSPI